MRPSARWLRPALAAGALVLAAPTASVATHSPAPAPPACTDTSFLTMEVPGTLKSLICSGQTFGAYEFQGIPDGIGIAPGPTRGTVNLFVNHEESRVPFPAPPASNAQADFQDSSVSRLTVSKSTGAIVAADVALSASMGFIRFCSSYMTGPEQGFSRYRLFTNEDADDVVDVPPGAPYGADPSVTPRRQAGYAVMHDVKSGNSIPIPGMGRHNHENTMPIPGGWRRFALLSGDDTFNPPSSQLYMYLAKREKDIAKDRGSLWAFRVTRTGAGPVDPANPFNNANDYGDIKSGDVWQGKFIKVPPEIAKGQTAERPQVALENWSNANNVFQFIRIEDTDYSRGNHRIVYLADTGTTRVVPDPATGRLRRGPSGTVGLYDNGRIFRMKFNKKNPRQVDSFSILLNADTGGPGGPGGAMHQPDNVGISRNSLMVQEDAAPPSPNSRIWRYDFRTGTWSVIAHVVESDWESSGIVSAAEWGFGRGSWFLDVQGHGDDDWVDHQNPAPGRPYFLRQEAGQLLLMTVPGS
jgi:hypothetical protein